MITLLIIIVLVANIPHVVGADLHHVKDILVCLVNKVKLQHLFCCYNALYQAKLQSFYFWKAVNLGLKILSLA